MATQDLFEKLNLTPEQVGSLKASLRGRLQRQLQQQEEFEQTVGLQGSPIYTQYVGDKRGKRDVERRVTRLTPIGAGEAAAIDPATGEETGFLARATPFYASMVGQESSEGLIEAAEAFEAGRATEDQITRLENFADYQFRDRTLAAKIFGMSPDLLNFAGSFLIGGGVGKALGTAFQATSKGKKITQALSKFGNGRLSALLEREAVKKFATTRTGRYLAKVGATSKEAGKLFGQQAVGQLAAGEAANILGIGTSQVRANHTRLRLQRDLEIDYDDTGRIMASLSQRRATDAELLPQALLDYLIEVGSEVSGPVLAELVPAIQYLGFQKLAKRKGWKKALAIHNATGIGGIAEELGEEFLGGILRETAAALGPEMFAEMKGSFPSDADEILALAANVAMFGAATTGVGAAAKRMQLSNRLPGALDDDRGRALVDSAVADAELAERQPVAAGEALSDVGSAAAQSALDDRNQRTGGTATLAEPNEEAYPEADRQRLSELTGGATTVFYEGDAGGESPVFYDPAADAIFMPAQGVAVDPGMQAEFDAAGVETSPLAFLQHENVHAATEALLRNGRRDIVESFFAAMERSNNSKLRAAAGIYRRNVEGMNEEELREEGAAVIAQGLRPFFDYAAEDAQAAEALDQALMTDGGVLRRYVIDPAIELYNALARKSGGRIKELDTTAAAALRKLSEGFEGLGARELEEGARLSMPFLELFAEARQAREGAGRRAATQGQPREGGAMTQRREGETPRQFKRRRQRARRELGRQQQQERSDGERGRPAAGGNRQTLRSQAEAQGRPAPETLPGAPQIRGATGPDPRLSAAARDYAESAGIEFRRQAAYVEVDEEFAGRIAEAYDQMEDAPNDPAVREAYADLMRQTRAQYDALERAGYSFYFYTSENDPYAGNPWNAMRDIRENQVMAVYATEDGFGEGALDLDEPGQHPLLVDTGLEWPFGSPDGPKQRVLANDLFRAVHDAFGHGLEGAGFRAKGEENAWQAHTRLYTGPALGALATETRGQNSWLNFGPFGEANRTASVEDTVFAEQKAGLMPSWTWSERIAPGSDRPAVTMSRAARRQVQRQVAEQRERVQTERQGEQTPLSKFQRFARTLVEAARRSGDEQVTQLGAVADRNGLTSITPIGAEQVSGERVDLRYKWESEDGGGAGGVRVLFMDDQPVALEPFVDGKDAGRLDPPDLDGLSAAIQVALETQLPKGQYTIRVPRPKDEIQEIAMGAVAAQPGFEGTVRTGSGRIPVQSVLLDRPAFISKEDAKDRARADIGNLLSEGSAETAPMLSAVRESGANYTLVYTWLAPITEKRKTEAGEEETFPTGEAFIMAATVDVKKPYRPVMDQADSERAAEGAERTSLRLESAPLTQRDEETDEEYAARRKRVEREPGDRFSPENLFPGEESGFSAPYEAGLTGAAVNSSVAINFKNYGKTLIEDVESDNDARVGFLSGARGSYVRNKLAEASGDVSGAAFAAIRTVVQDAFTNGYIPDGRASVHFTTPGDKLETKGKREKVYIRFGRRLYSMLNGIRGSIADFGSVDITVDSRVDLRSDPAAVQQFLDEFETPRREAQRKLDPEALRAERERKAQEQASQSQGSGNDTSRDLSGVTLGQHTSAIYASHDIISNSGARVQEARVDGDITLWANPGGPAVPQDQRVRELESAFRDTHRAIRETGGARPMAVVEHNYVHGYGGGDNNSAEAQAQRITLAHEAAVGFTVAHGLSNPTTLQSESLITDTPPYDRMTSRGIQSWLQSSVPGHPIVLIRRSPDSGNAMIAFVTPEAADDLVDFAEQNSAAYITLRGVSLDEIGRMSSSGEEGFVDIDSDMRDVSASVHREGTLGFTPEAGFITLPNATLGALPEGETMSMAQERFERMPSTIHPPGRTNLPSPTTSPATEWRLAGPLELASLAAYAQRNLQAFNEAERRRQESAQDRPALVSRRRSASLYERFDEGPQVRSDSWRTKLQDYFLPARRAQERIERLSGVVTENGDVSAMQDLMDGKVADQVDRLTRTLIRPMIATLRTAGLQLNDLNDWVYAKHHQPRHELMKRRFITDAVAKAVEKDIRAEIERLRLTGMTKAAATEAAEAKRGEFTEIRTEQKTRLADRQFDPNNAERSGTGMSNEQAEEILGRYSGSDVAALDKAADYVYEMLRQSRANLVEGQLITQEAADAWVEAFGETYVPLRKQEESMPIGPRTAGINQAAPITYRAQGRRSVADDPVVYAVSQAENAIRRKETNAVGLSMLTLLRDNVGLHDAGIYVRETLPEDAELGLTSFVVRENGKPVEIDLRSEAFATSLKRTGSPGALPQLKVVSAITRWLSKAVTVYNPGFILPNLVRDLGTALVTIEEQQVAGIRNSILGDVIGTGKPAMRVAYNMLRDNYDAIQDEGYRESARLFMEMGVKTGFFYAKPIGQHRADLQRELNRGAFGTALAKADEVVADLNGAVENATRLAAFHHLRMNGVSDLKAAEAAKNLTVNFNRRGQWGSNINSFYMFYNASIQGSARILGAINHKNPEVRKNVRKIVGGIIAAGFIQEILMEAFGDEDETGVTHYSKLPEHEKDRNIMLGTPGDNFFMKIPMPYGFNTFYTMGRKIAQTAFFGRGVVDAAMDIAGSAYQAYSPIGTEATFLQMVSPTVSDPIFQAYENKTFSGRPIMPEHRGFGPEPPLSQRYFENVSAPSKWMAKTLNSLFGGDEWTPAKIPLADISPEWIDHIAEAFTGGVFKFFGRSANVTEKLLSGEFDLTQPGDYPIVRRFISSAPPWTTSRIFYEELDSIERKHLLYEGARERRDLESARRIVSESKTQLRMRKSAQAAREQISKLRKKRDAQTDNRERARYDNMINQRMKRWLLSYNRATSK